MGCENVKLFLSKPLGVFQKGIYLFHNHALHIHPIFRFEVLIGRVGHSYSCGYLIDGYALRAFIFLILPSLFARILMQQLFQMQLGYAWAVARSML